MISSDASTICRAHPYCGGTSGPGTARSASPPASTKPALYPTAAAHGYYRASPEGCLQRLLGQAAPGQWAAGASDSAADAAGAAAKSRPRATSRSPSSDGEAATSWNGFADDRAFDDGAATLLAAAAEVDSASAAAAEAAVNAALATGATAAASTPASAAAAAASAPARAAITGREGSGDSATLALATSAAAVPPMAAAGSPLAPATPTQQACMHGLPAAGVHSVCTLPGAAPVVPAWALALSRSPDACRVVGASRDLLLRTLLEALQRGSTQGAS